MARGGLDVVSARDDPPNTIAASVRSREILLYLFMKHLIISREYPPSPYAPGGIGTYIANIARLMVDRGETVHIIGQRWDDAPLYREETAGGNLVIHRIGIHDLPPNDGGDEAGRLSCELEGLKKTQVPNQWFAWHAAIVAERLIEEEVIDVIEGQEWEMPLYYLLLRRALGLGPERQPPCIVHLHCPTEMARRFNGAASAPPEYDIMRRMESYCIHAADFLLCPSHYLARQCADHFNLAPERIKVIHLPVGFTPLLERDREVWEHGSICFVGRLEPRKGIVEWVDAATVVAAEDPKVHFDFIGADIWGLQRQLIERLPLPLRHRFRFHGSKRREELPAYLARARAAVVPSRWENFPNVCIEAMSSGLPVIATRLGGMVELLEDGRTGWLCPDTGIAGMTDGLADTLRRCLSASADQRAAMGRAASEEVRRICDNERTVNEQIAFRAEVTDLGAHRSLELGMPSRRWSRPKQGLEPNAPDTNRDGAGIVVAVERLSEAASVLPSVYAQTKPPRALCVVSAEPPSNKDTDLARQIEDQGGTILIHPGRSVSEAWNAGLAASPAKGEVAFWSFLDSHDYLLPDCLARIEGVMSRRPDVGIVSFWTQIADGSEVIEAAPCPDLLHQLTKNEVTPASGIRAEAIGTLPFFRPGMARDYDIWDAANQVMAKDWSVVTYPGILAQRDFAIPSVSWPQSTALLSVRAELLSRFSEVLEPEVFELIGLYVPIPRMSMKDESAIKPSPIRQIPHYLLTAVLHPTRAFKGVLRRYRKIVYRRRQRSLRISGSRP